MTIFHWMNAVFYKSVPIARMFEVDFGLGMERPLRKFNAARGLAMLLSNRQSEK